MPIIYHFTAHRFLKDILKQGLTKGLLTQCDDDGKLYFAKENQWLTISSSFKQSWFDPKLNKLPYERTDIRLSIRIPDTEKKNLVKWLEYCKKNDNPINEHLNCSGDPENWLLFLGKIKPEWIKSVKYNPAKLINNLSEEEIKWQMQRTAKNKKSR